MTHPFDRELTRAQAIIDTPPGVYTQSLVTLSERALRAHAGWNVTSLPALGHSPQPRRNLAAGRGAFSEVTQ